MKIIVVGGTGTIGKAIVNELRQRHEVVVVSHTKSDLQVDITDSSSIKEMYKKIGPFDALVSATGKVKFSTLTTMSSQDYEWGLQNKLMGQVNLVLLGLPFIHKQGSFTLTSGILNNDPIVTGSSAAMVNGALDGFVKSAAIEMPNQVRINTVSPTVVEEAMDKYADYFRGFEPVSAAKVALAYSKSVEGSQTGQVFKVGY